MWLFFPLPLLAATPVSVASSHGPVIVGSSSSMHATMSSFGRKIFWARGSYWAFYTNGSNPMYKTSKDGLVWGNATYVGNGNPDGSYWDVSYDNTTGVVYYC